MPSTPHTRESRQEYLMHAFLCGVLNSAVLDLSLLTLRGRTDPKPIGKRSRRRMTALRLRGGWRGLKTKLLQVDEPSWQLRFVSFQ